MDHKCHKEEIISEVVKALNGNGQPGLRQTVPALTESVNGLIKRLDRMDQRGQFNVTTIIAILAVVVSVYAIIKS
jgi:hypothetical protein